MVRGNGQPCLLVHGSYVTHKFWAKQIPALIKRFKVICPDLRGHGLSDKPRGEYNVKIFAKDMHQLLRKLNLENTHIIGHSMGSRICLQFCLDYPEAVNRMVLAGANAAPPRHEHIPIPNYTRKVRKDGTKGFNKHKFTEYKLQSSMFAMPTKEKMKAFKQLLTKTPNYVKVSVEKNFAKTDFRKRLPEIKAPTLVMVGQKDVITLPENAKYIAEHMPNAKLKVIPEVGHCLPIEKPEEFNTEIMKFLVDSAHLIE